LHDVWDRLGQSESAQQLLREMDLELGRMRLAQARLKAVVAQEEATNRQLRLRLGPVLKELDQRLDNESASVERLHDNLDQVNAAMLAAVQRAQTLEQRATEAEARATAARRELTEERTWVAKQARLLAGSQAWRLGHGMARTARLLTFRRHRGTDSVQRIIARMEDGLGTHGSSGRDK
jgi:chromosome segregation ATPase